jgi:RNA polymerase sigma-70 factor, ECF subfamily
LPAGLGSGSDDPDADLDVPGGRHHWLEPLPDTLTPEVAVGVRQSVRLAVATALQELPARQRAVLILRDVAQFSAAEVAELLETSTASVNSALQRARTHLAEVAPEEDAVAEPDDARLRELLDRYCAAFENADLDALTELLQDDVRLEMPPLATWFAGRDAVTQFLVQRAFAEPGDIVFVPTAANGQPAVAEYRRSDDNVLRAHSIHIISAGDTGIARMVVFLDPELFSVFGLPATR